MNPATRNVSKLWVEDRGMWTLDAAQGMALCGRGALHGKKTERLWETGSGARSVGHCVVGRDRS